MASEEKAEAPPPAYVEPATTAVAVIDKERPVSADSAWSEPAPARDPQRLNTHLQVYIYRYLDM